MVRAILEGQGLIDSYLVDKITRVRPVRDEHGRESNSLLKVYKARIESTTRAIRGIDGEYKQMSYVIFVHKNADIQIEDRIQFGDYVTGDPEWSVQSVFRAHGFDLSHYEVLV